MDTIGQPDYALQSSDGRILSIGSTELVSLLNSRLQKTLTFFIGYSATLPLIPNSPRYVILSVVTIRLVKSVIIDAVSVEHILADISPTTDISNALNEFSVYGLLGVNDSRPIHLGNFAYEINVRQPLQLFPIAIHQAFPIIRFEIHSNHGHKSNTTYVYRIRRSW